MKLFDDYDTEPPKAPKAAKKVVRRKGTIYIRLNNNTDLPFAVDFEGFQEGNCRTCKTEDEVQAIVERLKQEKSSQYNLKVEDEREPSIKYAYLNEWKNFIIKICKEKEEQAKQEAKSRSDSVWVDFNSLDYEPEIWFDKSAPYDCEIAVRMKSHKCYYQCITFRFQRGMLEAWDNGFQSSMGSGTNMLFAQHQTHIDRQNIIRELMERVLNNECCKEANETKPRIHEVDEHGWLIRDGIHNLLNIDD